MAEDTQQRDPKQATPDSDPTSWLFKILSWVAGGLSVIYLTRDLNWFTLHGTVAEWVDTYQRIVGDVRSFLFGWIHISWLQVSQLEAHGLVLSVIFGSSWMKAANRAITDDIPPAKVPPEFRWFGDLLYTPIWLCIMAVVGSLLALLLPGQWGFWVPIALSWLLGVWWSGFGLRLFGVGGVALIVVLVGTLLR